MADLGLSQIRKHPYLKKAESQAAMGSIHDMIVDLLLPLDVASSNSCAYESTIRQIEVDLWFLWTIIIDAIKHLGGETTTSQRMAECLVYISRLPDVIDENEIAHRSESGGRIWRDLPDFSFYFFEQGIYHILLEDIESSRHGATVHGASIRLANANIFAGLYLCRLEPNEPPNELSSMRKVAREHLMYTLEIPFDALERVRRTELYVAPAAAWIAIAGPKLYQYSMSNADYTDKDVLLYWIGGVYGGLGL